jgi:hypothetical protein
MVERWVEICTRSLPFPDPPFDTIPPLFPISSQEDLVREGLEMDNCIGNLLGEVALGDRYFFRWEGDERCSVEFIYDEGYWILGECQGPGNSDASEFTRLQIERTQI